MTKWTDRAMDVCSLIIMVSLALSMLSLAVFLLRAALR